MAELSVISYIFYSNVTRIDIVNGFKDKFNKLNNFDFYRYFDHPDQIA